MADNVIKFNVIGMSCAACAARVDAAAKSVDGVVDCNVNLLTNSMDVVSVSSDDTLRRKVTQSVTDAVSKSGYKAIPISDAIDSKSKVDNLDESYKGEIKNHVYRLVSSGILLIILMYVSMGPMLGLRLPQFLLASPMTAAVIEAILSLSIMCINYKFFINGIRGFIHLSPNMDSLVAMGSLVSYALSIYLMTRGEYDMLYFDSAAMILVFITIGKLLEAISKKRTGSALRDLISMSPKMANRIVDGTEEVVRASSLKAGDICRVYMGEMIPADGIIIDGTTAVDESSLTGESALVSKHKGDRVYSATDNYKGNFLMEVTAVGEDTSFGKIITIVENASASKAPIARLADKIASYFVPAVILIALITLIVWLIIGDDKVDAIIHAVSVLVISCPCALGLATPVAIMVGNGRAARAKILFKSASIMEIIGRTKTIVFDKTGTITRGIPKGLTVDDYDTMEDVIKPDSAFAIDRLSGMGIDTYMLSGDRQEVASKIASQVGIASVIAGVLPDGKADEVTSLMEHDDKRPLMMVGDGINDAPALSIADIGVAIGSGTDIAIDSADVVLQADSLVDVVNAVLIGRKTLRVIKQNLFWAFIYNIIGIPIAAGIFGGLGLELSPQLAALFMSLSSFCVVMNALRLNRIKLISYDNSSAGDNLISDDVISNDNKEGDYKMTIKIEGMMCPHCEAHCKEELEKLDFVISASPSHEQAEAILEIDESKYDEACDKAKLAEAVAAAGYKMVS